MAHEDIGSGVVIELTALEPLGGLGFPVSLAANVINYNTSELTICCVESLLACGFSRVAVLDNASAEADRQNLVAGLDKLKGYAHAVELFVSGTNLGFAAGSNLLLERTLKDDRVTHVLLINSDSILVPEGFAILHAMLGSKKADLFGGRVHQRTGAETGGVVESMGIAIYKPLLASNRKHAYEKFLGPTGGCAIYSRRVLEDIRAAHGYVFDPDYFCYAEDTDLCLRTRLLGYQAAYCDELLAWHIGQASSGGGFNDFVYYHGIRNSLWTLVKCIPGPLLAKSMGWILLLHCGIVLRHTLRGKIRVTARIYWHTIMALPALLKKRRVIQASRRIEVGSLKQWITPRLYESSFLRLALRELFIRGKRRNGPA